MPSPSRSPRRGQDDGMALLTVIGAMTILTLFLLTSLAVVIQNARPTRQDQDGKAALAAAQAGIEEYLSRLNANDTYYTVGNNDSTNPALVATGPGRTVPGTTGTAASFRYQVLTTAAQTARDGVIRLQVVGTASAGTGARAVSRTLTASLQPKGFLRYVYLSDVEVVDPALLSGPFYVKVNGSSYCTTACGQSSSSTRFRYAVDGSDVVAGARCGGYYDDGVTPSRRASWTVGSTSATRVRIWDTSPSPDTWATSPTTYVTSGTATSLTCQDIQWTTGDIVQGPLHSNDALQVGGSVLFTDPLTESSWADCTGTSALTNCWWGSGTPSSTGPSGQPGYRPVYGAALSLPDSNTELRTYTQPGGTNASGTPGCYYTGATRIIFQGTTMRVYSPGTTTSAANCFNGTNRATEQTFTIPPIIYVNGASTSCSGNSVGYPISSEDTTGTTMNYDPCRGSAYVSGQVGSGSTDVQVTVATKDDILITGDLTYHNTSSSDVIGLVATNNVWVFHPVNSSGTNLLTSAQTPRNIHAAILSLLHSFIVENYAEGAGLSTSTSTSSKLNVLGAISQKFRGPVGTSGGGTGYLKNYIYDPRLKALQPPFFLKPNSSPWQIQQVVDK